MQESQIVSSDTCAIIILGCFDTKSEDFGYLYQCLKDQDVEIITIDTGIFESKTDFRIDFDSEKVASASGANLTDLQNARDRSTSLELMGKGAGLILSNLLSQRRIKGVIGMGGGGGTFVSLLAMQSLPLEIPKLCLSTVASKDLSRQVGSKNILLMPSVVDVAGLNKISRLVIRQAAGALIGMVASTQEGVKEGNSRTIAISMFGNTTECVEHCTQLLKEKGYEVLAFHSVGAGGRTMEALIREGLIDGVLDITTTELADELCDGICSAGKDRLTAASDMGIPQIVVPGCIDMVNYGHVDTVPEQYKDRLLFRWAPDVTLMRTNTEENVILGTEIAEKLNASKGKVVVCLPLLGISIVSREGEVFYAPESDKVLFDTIKAELQSNIPVIESPTHINDIQFAEVAVFKLLELL
ncbi:MAG: hypothetical protein ACI9FN_001730 [Saprospiraceae bacterium]|jgi:uncharacterized protein (UPF0261 family)